MAKKDLPTPEDLHKALVYDEDAGVFYWRRREPEAFPNPSAAPSWNTRFAGKAALTTVDSYGYFVGSVFCCAVKAHRVAWAMHYGEWPHGIIDHINRDRQDNRIANLRCVTPAENNRNQKLNKRNKSGCPGVHWDKRQRKWHTTINSGGRPIFLGLFKEKEDAAEARRQAERVHGFAPNHGR